MSLKATVQLFLSISIALYHCRKKSISIVYTAIQMLAGKPHEFRLLYYRFYPLPASQCTQKFIYIYVLFIFLFIYSSYSEAAV